MKNYLYSHKRILMSMLIISALTIIGMSAITYQDKETLPQQQTGAQESLGSTNTSNAPRPLFQHERARATIMPNIRSKVSELEVVSSELDELGIVHVTVRNNSDKGVMSYSLMGGEKAGASTVIDGLAATPPEVVIPPHQTHTLGIGLKNLFADEDLVVASAIFEDGTEKGMAWALKVSHDGRDDLARKRLTK